MNFVQHTFLAFRVFRVFRVFLVFLVFFMLSSGSPAWARFQQTSAECPRIAKEFLDRERSSQPDHWFRQEYLCEFIDGSGSLFRADLIQSAIDPNVPTRNL